MLFHVRLEETWLDYPSPDEIAIMAFFCGCEHHCKGCHSPLLQQEYEYDESNEQLLNRITEYAKRTDTNKLVFLGGDPLYSKNLPLITFLVNNLKNDFDICIFTGYDIEYVKSTGIKGVKFWKCGKFDIDNARESKKSDEEYVLASPNQNFYDDDYNLISSNGILKF